MGLAEIITTQINAPRGVFTRAQDCFGGVPCLLLHFPPETILYPGLILANAGTHPGLLLEGSEAYTPAQGRG